MKINKKSWHYRLYDHCYKVVSTHNLESHWSSPPSTLCGYFWGFVWNVFGYVGLFALLGLAIVHPAILAFSWLRNGSHVAKEVLIAEAAVVVILILLLCARLAYDWLEEYSRREVSERVVVLDTGLSFLGVVAGTVRAAKNKVCPMIKYED